MLQLYQYVKEYLVMKKLHDLILEVSSFPEIYLGKPSLERLYAFIGGFLYQNEAANDSSLDGFTAYIAQKYGIQTDHNWASIIQFFSYDEREAFDSFIMLYKSYCDQRTNNG